MRVRGDIKYFPSECGPWRVRFLLRVVQIVGLVGFYSDVALEKWSIKENVWKPVKMSRKPVKNSNRERVHRTATAGIVFRTNHDLVLKLCYALRKFHRTGIIF